MMTYPLSGPAYAMTSVVWNSDLPDIVRGSGLRDVPMERVRRLPLWGSGWRQQGRRTDVDRGVVLGPHRVASVSCGQPPPFGREIGP